MWAINGATAFNLDRADFITVIDRQIVAIYSERQVVLGIYETHEEAVAMFERKMNTFGEGATVVYMRGMNV